MKRPGGKYARTGKLHIVAIGIDRYRSKGFNRLHNAVSDARGAVKAFTDVGFAERKLVLDEDATKQALERLVQDELRTLDQDDSLVLFYAGHGHTETHYFGDGARVKTGYLIPADAERDQVNSWINLGNWLDTVDRLPPRHILVILDACHSGIALSTIMRWRASVQQTAEAIEKLTSRRSRRIITSALDDEQAMDGGPFPGHSLFTGCLIEALTLGVRQGSDYATGLNIGAYIKDRVMSYPGAKQTPDIGVLALHDHGDLVVTLRKRAPDESVAPLGGGTTRSGGKIPPHDRRQPRDPRRLHPPVVAEQSTSGSIPPSATKPPPPSPLLRSGAGAPPTSFSSALDRHVAQRKQKSPMLSMISGEPALALAELGTWSAQRGTLTLVTAHAQPDAAVAELLAHMPWLRCLPGARACLAKAARLDISAVDASIDARAGRELHRWLSNLAAGDPAIQVSGWLLASLRDPDAAPDVASAPVQGRELLAALAALTAPLSVTFSQHAPTESWLGDAIVAAAGLTRHLPQHSVAVVAPGELVTRVLTSRDSSAISMARQGLIKLDKSSSAPAHQRGPMPKTPDLNGAEAALHLALARDPRTRAARFEQHVMAPTHEREREIQVALAAHAPRLIIELDSWYHLRDETAYHNQRLKDLWLQRAGFFVMRFLVEDVERRLGEVIDEIALGLVGRR